jgi:hypothetical protein
LASLGANKRVDRESVAFLLEAEVFGEFEALASWEI